MLVQKAITKSAIAVVLTLSLLSCDQGVDRGELPGIYEFQEDGLKQQLRLQVDGTYLSTLWVGGTVSWSIQDSWSYEEHGGKAGLVFSQFRFGMKDTSERRGFWFVVPEKTLTRKIRLCFDLDLNRCFQQI